MTVPTAEQLAVLVERACRHLEPDEAALLRAGVARLEATRRSLGGTRSALRRAEQRAQDAEDTARRRFGRIGSHTYTGDGGPRDTDLFGQVCDSPKTDHELIEDPNTEETP